MIWTTKDGTKIPIDELDNNHLKNCIAMMDRMPENFVRKPLYDALVQEFRWRERNGIKIINEGSMQRIETDETRTTPQPKWEIINKGKSDG